MSEVKLNLVDAQTILTGCIHGSVADRCVAALSAEPETITELASALGRFHKPDETHGPFASFRRACEVDNQPWDAGVVIIDLAARIVATESSYSQPGPDGEVCYHNGEQATDVSVPYRLPDDWLFVNSFEAYDWARERHREQRVANSPFDVRAVLYGPPLLDHIAKSVLELNSEILSPKIVSNGDESPDPLAKEISRIHAEWLMTPREDLRGHSPREMLLAKQNFIDFDLQFRELQWTFLSEGPPCLPPDSHAYRFAGFGTHEWVVYYDLVRHLLWTATSIAADSSVKRSSGTAGVPPPSGVKRSSGSAGVPPPSGVKRSSGSAGVPPAMSAQREQCAAENNATTVESVPSAITNGSIGSRQLAIGNVECSPTVRESVVYSMATLDQLKTTWLETPQHDYSGRVPAIIIDNERRRLPIAMSSAEIMIDEDCDICRMSAMEAEMGFGPAFWHLDGCNMDDEFVFSSYLTREEWEAEQRRYREFTEQFNREQVEKKREEMEESLTFEENLAREACELDLARRYAEKRQWEEDQERLARGEVVHDDFDLDWPEQSESDSVNPDPDPVF